MAVKASTPPAMRVLVRKRTKAIIVAGGMAVMAVAGGGWHGMSGIGMAHGKQARGWYQETRRCKQTGLKICISITDTIVRVGPKTA